MLNKKYKAIIIDVDGTLVPNRKEGKPSPRVKKAIEQARTHVHVGIASGRPVFLLRDIFTALKMSGPSIIYGGAQVVDSKTHKILWEQPLSKNQIRDIYNIVHPLTGTLSSDETFANKQIDINDLPEKVYSLYSGVIPLEYELAEKVINKLSAISDVVGHIVPGWYGGFAVNINHASATKQHGIFEVAKMLKIDTNEIIGIGDGGNDMPLLMACGLKVAMGNANDDLKAIADYIAPTVEEDGVADVIEKFILSPKFESTS